MCIKCPYRVLIVFPAQAGVIPPAAGAVLAVERIPRASGGDPILKLQRAVAILYSPRKRG